MINNFETFAFKAANSELEKVYILCLNSEENATKFFYFTTSKDKKSKSTIIEKTLPYLSKRPNFRDKEYMISKMDSWILLS